jgi:hypothetical protein
VTSGNVSRDSSREDAMRALNAWVENDGMLASVCCVDKTRFLPRKKLLSFNVPSRFVKPPYNNLLDIYITKPKQLQLHL